MRKKTILTLCLTILTSALPLGTTAAQKEPTLLILTKDNVQHQFALPEKPQVSFEGTDLVIHSEKTDARFAISDVVRFTYQKIDPSGIDIPVAPETGINYDDGTLVISQLEAGASVSIYSLDGRLVQQLNARRTGTYRLSLASLPFGVYLVKTGTITYKITKR